MYFYYLKRWTRWTVLLFLILLLCDKGRTQAVFELTEQTFDEYTRDKDVMIVEFFMPW